MRSFLSKFCIKIWKRSLCDFRPPSERDQATERRFQRELFLSFLASTLLSLYSSDSGIRWIDLPLPSMFGMIPNPSESYTILENTSKKMVWMKRKIPSLALPAIYVSTRPVFDPVRTSFKVGETIIRWFFGRKKNFSPCTVMEKVSQKDLCIWWSSFCTYRKSDF